MAHLTNFSLKYFYEIFTEDASPFCLYHGAKKSKMTKNSNQGGSCLNINSTWKSPRSISPVVPGGSIQKYMLWKKNGIGWEVVYLFLDGHGTRDAFSGLRVQALPVAFPARNVKFPCLESNQLGTKRRPWWRESQRFSTTPLHTTTTTGSSWSSPLDKAECLNSSFAQQCTASVMNMPSYIQEQHRSFGKRFPSHCTALHA